jgi:hypothetical protein
MPSGGGFVTPVGAGGVAGCDGGVVAFGFVVAGGFGAGDFVVCVGGGAGAGTNVTVTVLWSAPNAAPVSAPVTISLPDPESDTDLVPSGASVKLIFVGDFADT